MNKWMAITSHYVYICVKERSYKEELFLYKEETLTAGIDVMAPEKNK